MRFAACLLALAAPAAAWSTVGGLRAAQPAVSIVQPARSCAVSMRERPAKGGKAAAVKEPTAEELLAAAKAELEAAKAEMAAAKAEVKTLSKKPKAPKAPKAPQAPRDAPSFSLPSISLPSVPSISLPSGGAAPEGVDPLAGLAAGVALGAVPAAALVSVRVWITSRRAAQDA